jgi:hypothetical protein
MAFPTLIEVCRSHRLGRRFSPPCGRTAKGAGPALSWESIARFSMMVCHAYFFSPSPSPSCHVHPYLSAADSLSSPSLSSTSDRQTRTDRLIGSLSPLETVCARRACSLFRKTWLIGGREQALESIQKEPRSF